MDAQAGKEQKAKTSFHGLGKEYWKYWIASSFGMAASNVTQYVLSLYVLDVTGSATVFASMLAITVLPRIFLSPFAGVIADRMSRNRIMAVALLMDALVFTAYFVMGSFSEVSIPLVTILIVSLEIVEVFYDGAAGAIIPELVPKERIKDAIAVSHVDNGIVMVAGPMFAAAIYSNLTISGAFLVMAALDLGSFLLHVATRPPYAVTRGGREKGAKKNGFLADFLFGLKVIRGNPFLRVFIVILPVVNAFFASPFSVSIKYLLREEYSLNAYLYGIYNSVTSSVSLIVPFFALPIVRKFKPRAIYATCTMLIAIELAFIGVAAALGVYGAIPTAASVILITILDCITIAEAIPMQITYATMIQTSVEKEVLGRVTSVVRMVSLASISLGELLFGALNDAVGVVQPIFLGALGVGTASVLFRLLIRDAPAGAAHD